LGWQCVATSRRESLERYERDGDLSAAFQLFARTVAAKRMDFSGTRAEVEKLLKGFLVGTQNVRLEGQVLNIEELPAECRERVRAADSSGRVWGAWSTELGVMVVWANYDAEGSRRLKWYVLLYLEWYIPPGEFHAAWFRCNPRRPTEWIIGRGLSGETP
jgi:hypothetical protein